MRKRGLGNREIASKMLKTWAMAKNPSLRRHIPETCWYRPEALGDMLSRHGFVFLKPDKGGGGGGAIRLRILGSGDVELKTLKHTRVLKPGDSIRRVEQCMIPGKRYIIQQGIRLATVKGRPFDIRVHLQKVKGEWLVLGMCAKVAAPGKIVTNHCKGGQPMEPEEAVRMASGSSFRAREVTDELHACSLDIAKTLNHSFKGIRELGIDAGLDENFLIWIFEVNTRPDFKMFRYLKDRSVWRKIRDMHRLLQ
ncbi:YheC/YheD family protein [Staphylospora marina]|uniref:YheC/YheD family protein n=1 Tax=Staphylospora marina TaxID=2490858 RepID=UPI0013DE47B2|nr:YheC/YheD family protein [Staphylospora marina]